MQKETQKKRPQNLNRQELIAQVSRRTGCPPTQVSTIVDVALEDIIQAVAEGEKVGLTGFGVFTQRERKGREGVDPRSFERIMIDAVTVPHFKPGRSFKEAVRQTVDEEQTGQ